MTPTRCAVLCLLAATLGAQPARSPLSLRVKAQRATVAAGEGIVLDLHVQVRSALRMESVELNRDRTQVVVTSLDNPKAPRRLLTGRDHIRLHGVPALSAIGSEFDVKPGDAWTAQLDLLQYSLPLERGRYRIETAYRYGASEKEAVQGNPIDVTVESAGLEAAQCRWFGDGEPRRHLECLWRVRHGKEAVTLYQSAGARELNAVRHAVRVPGLPSAGRPRQGPVLAHLNDAAGNHFSRYAVWLHGRNICWMAVQPRGAAGSSKCGPHGLQEGALLAEPPLQTKSGGLFAVVTTPGSTSVVQAAAGGNVDYRLLPLGSAGSAVVVWSINETKPSGRLYLSGARLRSVDLETGQQQELGEGGASPRFLVDQWQGNGQVFAISGTESLTVKRIGGGEPRKWAMRAAGQYREAVLTSTAEPPTLVFESPDAWKFLALTAGGGQILSRANSGTYVATVAADSGLYVIAHNPDQGLKAIGPASRAAN